MIFNKLTLFLILAVALSGCDDSNGHTPYEMVASPPPEKNLGHVRCSRREAVYIKAYEVNENLEKNSLYGEMYSESLSRRIHLAIDIREISSPLLLVECYTKELKITNRALLHAKKGEKWLDSKLSTSPTYFTSDLTELYYRSYRAIAYRNLTVSKKKEMAEKEVRKIYNNLPEKWYIGYRDILDDDHIAYTDDWNIKMEFIEEYSGLNRYSVINELEKLFFFRSININPYVKASFYKENLSVIANEKTNGWYKSRFINSDRTGGTIQNVTQDGKDFIMIRFESNREKEGEQSAISISLDVDVGINSKNDLFLVMNIENIAGLSEVGSFGNTKCSGVSGVSIGYIDYYGNIIGHTILANMQDSLSSLISSTGVYTNPRYLSSNNTRNVIRLNYNRYRDISINIGREISEIPNITNSNQVREVKISLVAADFFTDGDYYHWSGIRTSTPSCNKAKALMDISEIGLYKVEN